MSDESRVVDSNSDDFERTQELALRPKTLKEFVGQKRVANQLDLLLSAARNRNSPADHVLLSGPPGVGNACDDHCFRDECTDSDYERTSDSTCW